MNNRTFQQWMVLCAAMLSAIWFCREAYAQEPPKQAVSVDLLVRGGTIVTMNPQRRVIDNGYIAVRGDEIVTVEVVVPQLRDERSKEILREFAKLNPEDPRQATFASV